MTTVGRVPRNGSEFSGMKRQKTVVSSCHFVHKKTTHDAFIYVLPVTTRMTPYSTCPQGHCLCRYHMDVVCHVDVLNLPEGAGDEALARGCPVCTGVCPCADCVRQHFGVLPYTTQRPPRQLVFALEVVARPLPPLGRAQPVRVRMQDFSNELYEKVVLRQQMPLVLTGVHELVQGGGLWDLPQQLRTRHRNAECPPLALCQVRVQGVSELDPGLFTVLEELPEMDPRFVFLQASGNGAHARVPLSGEFRDSPHGRCLWYLKDWNFGAWQPEWAQDLLRVLPERLKPRNEHDLLGGLTGLAPVHVLMAYMGAGGTRTPLHVDKAGSIAFNCLMWAETPDTSKRWWIFHPDDREALNAQIKSEVSNSNHLMEDSHWLDPHCFASIRGMRHPVISFEQRLGELVVVPPNAPHTVRNQGGVSFAVAANLIDADVALDAYQVQLDNQALQVKTVYKVCNATWGSMNRQRLSQRRAVMPTVLKACEHILKEELAALERLKSFPLGDMVKGREFLDMVTCDHCQTDVFNSYLLETRKERTFCPRQACVAYAVSMKQAMVKIVPRNGEDLMRELQCAKDCSKS